MSAHGIADSGNNGAEGRAWLDGLPSTVERLARAWQLALGAPFAGGSASLVLAVTCPDGAPAVLKVPMPDDENRNEADALRHYDGKGAVQLYAHDDRSGALLLELVTPGASLDELIAIACRAIRRLWRPPVSSHPFRPVRELAAEWVDGFPQGHARHGRPFPPPLIEHATELARLRIAQGLGTKLSARGPGPCCVQSIMPCGHSSRLPTWPTWPRPWRSWGKSCRSRE